MLGDFVGFPGVAAQSLATISHPFGVSNARFIFLKAIDAIALKKKIPALRGTSLS
jgi:hypothetical protein